jgi:hypothetical protein
MHVLFSIWVSLALASGPDMAPMESMVESDLVWLSTQESPPKAPKVEAVDPALEARLLGEPVASKVGSLVTTPPVSPISLHWLWIVGGLCVAAVGFVVRRGVTSKVVAPRQGMQVVERVVLQGNNGLTVVEVPETKGTVRRLLVGTGSGSPVLVADLGVVTVESDPGVERAAPEVSHAQASAMELEAELDREAAYVLAPAAPQHAPEPYRVVAARAVLEEVIAERNDVNRASKLYEAQR